MANPFSKGWKYLMQSLDTTIEENADPKIQIQQATEAAKKQHREVTESAARIIGNRNKLEMTLNRLVKDQEKLQNNARTALQQADKASAEGDSAAATEYTNTAEIFATQLVTVEQEIEDTKKMHAQATQAAEQAQQQQRQSEARLKEQMGQIDQLRAQVDQAKMQESSNEALESMQGIQADDSVPTLDSVRDKIEARYATALGAQELTENSVRGRMAEIETSGRDMAASSRLEQIRAELAGGGATGAADEITAGQEGVADDGAGDAEASPEPSSDTGSEDQKPGASSGQ
ncbi:PspA/IM30 family protein [Corynebacterium glyciniphilum]|uniref:PspA/IM30 family protein n=1 Tax=Corynebacterium glyciniphilum TaxID=1404244 RepID=UPI00264B2E8F|nr:PspA/IM30 family protein [Corynebacterium glyciniphilum]MDN5682537.1 PspA/IM30 family protein [Corynebacterium glyciniphilum]MDN6705775.1 PspA/IM30 family protein [Corynebacterium glyciniphilum]